jgi:diadenosine tetraphosphate (Ap4A) HIT family hydrolase
MTQAAAPATFRLDAAFLSSSVAVGDLALCAVRLQADARFPWLILLPRAAGLRELEDLSASDRGRLAEEAVAAGRAVRAMGEVLGRPVEKLNLGALGNVTPQLHLHVVGRRRDDAAWPGPVWGASGARPYQPAQQAAVVAAARTVLGL